MSDAEQRGVCSVCGKPFTDDEWDNRHTDPRDGLSDCHEGCCPLCNLYIVKKKEEE